MEYDKYWCDNITLVYDKIYILSQIGHALHFSRPAIDEEDQFANIEHELDTDVGASEMYYFIDKFV